MSLFGFVKDVGRQLFKKDKTRPRPSSSTSKPIIPGSRALP